ncbi:MAG: aminotransferase class III-fold pyridoxal phosphate-dependent enzyme [Myxococcales bacterium]|nr:MAG: aminotransferase class III-fold pyridoxal phosphate-dependent enzyme [Myxococcales bacterium]
MTTSRFPGPKSAAYLDELARYVIAEPFPFVLDLERSHGMRLATVDGQEIFDWAGYFGSKLIGHNHPGLADPAYQKRLLTAANNKTANPDYLTPDCVAYYRELHRVAPQCMKNARLEAYVVNSGAEAVENMMKYFINLYNTEDPGRSRPSALRRFLYFDQAFHGRTVFALNVTQLSHNLVLTKDFHGIVPGNIRLDFPAIDASGPAEANAARTAEALDVVEKCLRRYGEEVVGIIVEPIQGAGGHRVAEAEFFRGLSRLAHEHRVNLGFDEVQTAGGQTGTFFAVDQFDLPFPPQAIATGKKLGNGVVYMLYPMTDRNVLDSTWGGSLADMVRFVREMEIVREERLIEQTPEKTALLVRLLKALTARFPDMLTNVRGMGLYQGFSLKAPFTAAQLAEFALEEESLLLLTAGRATIRLRPNLSVTAEDIRLLDEMLERLLGKMRLSA